MPQIYQQLVMIVACFTGTESAFTNTMDRELTNDELIQLVMLEDKFTDLMELAESAPLKHTRTAAGHAAARVLAEMEAILGPDPGDEQMVAQAESMLVAAANGAM